MDNHIIDNHIIQTPEIIQKISLYSQVEDIFGYKQVCKRWREYVKTEKFWLLLTEEQQKRRYIYPIEKRAELFIKELGEPFKTDERNIYKQYIFENDDKLKNFATRFVAILPRACPQTLVKLFDEIPRNLCALGAYGLISSTDQIENLIVYHLNTKHLNRVLSFYVSNISTQIYQQHYVNYGPI